MSMYDEIKNIPEAAGRCYLENHGITLPRRVPYLGMGSSYFAPLALYYLGIPVHPCIASEYFLFLGGKKKKKQAVLISQSGESSETIWCRDLFESVIALTNDPASTLSTGKNTATTYLLRAGKEEFSATKSYINTLLTLYLGHGQEVKPALEMISGKMEGYEKTARDMASTIHTFVKQKGFKGAYILGNGPNIATAYEAALILSETTKIPFTGMALAQYDHGPKETARDSIVIVIRTKGRARQRTDSLLKTIRAAGALTLPVEENDLPEPLSPFTTIIPLNLLAWFLAREKGISVTFEVGNKITKVPK